MIYLLGHKGFVGSAIAKFLEKNRIEFRGIDRENYASLKGTSCDIFINAGGSSKKRLATEDPAKDLELNLISTLRTLADFKFRKYVLISSIDVYNDVSSPKNNSESAEIDASKLSNYGLSKYLCEMAVKKGCKNWLILRLGGMVGEGLKKNAIFDLLTRKSLFVHPQSKYQYMDTRDVAKVLWALKEKENEIYNVCGDYAVSLEDVAKNLGIILPKENYSLNKEAYNINVEKAKRIVAIRPSMDAVLEFAKSFKA